MEAELALWGATYQRMLTKEQAEIAVNNERIVPRDEGLAWQRRMESM